MCLVEPSLPLSVGLGPVSSPPGAGYHYTINTRTLPINLVMFAQTNQHGMVQFLPYPSGLPIA